MQRTFAPGLSERDLAYRAISDALSVERLGIAPNNPRPTENVAEVLHSVARVAQDVCDTSWRMDAASLVSSTVRFDVVLASLDDLEARVRPAIEEAKRRALALADVLAEEERLAAEEADAAARRERLDAEVSRRVASIEQERLAAVEAGVREQLLASTS